VVTLYRGAAIQQGTVPDKFNAIASIFWKKKNYKTSGLISVFYWTTKLRAGDIFRASGCLDTRIAFAMNHA